MELFAVGTKSASWSCTPWSASIFCRDDDKRTEAERVKRNMRMRGMRVEEIVVEEEEIEVEVEAEARGKSVKVLFPERMTRLVLCNRR
uniref:Uncharacterized protein n=1 Tax=Vespula pensylvanica TaxID=30213 RepID=A0A834NQY3_VESPE|nr:hypothetical protein H0235_012429 [Vespula pensylvanica]